MTEPADQHHPIHYYSMRQWSPYQGTIQVVEVNGFRAVSRDGITWQVQVRNEGIRFFTNGTWRADGSGNLIATDRTQVLIDALRQHPPLPFPAIDTVELWLLDQTHRLPLALMRSMPVTRRPFTHHAPRWQASWHEQEEFVSGSLGSGAPEHIAHHEVLERCISAEAGAFPAAQWFRRDPDGSGTGLTGSNIPDGLAGRVLGAEAFPDLLLREDWDDELYAQLVSDYHAWQAAELLTHVGLDHGTRDRLERDACKRASRVYAVRKVLPEIINKDLMETAFVEAVIRQTSAP